MDNTVTRFAQKDHEDYITKKYNSYCIVCGAHGKYHRIIDIKKQDIRFAKSNGILICDECKSITKDKIKFLDYLADMRPVIYNGLIKLFT